MYVCSDCEKTGMLPTSFITQHRYGAPGVTVCMRCADEWLDNALQEDYRSGRIQPGQGVVRRLDGTDTQERSD